MSLIIDLSANGLIMGLFYALMAVGLSMIFGILRIVNFAHGEFFMVGAYVYAMSAMKVGLNPWVALLVAGLAGAFWGC